MEGSYCERMCELMKRYGMARLMIPGCPSCSSADSLVENMITMVKTLAIDRQKTTSLGRRPGFYVWSSRGKCAPYAVPRKLCLADSKEDLYSAMKDVHFHGNLDVTRLRLQLLESPEMMEIPRRRRYVRFNSCFCPRLNDRLI